MLDRTADSTCQGHRADIDRLIFRARVASGQDSSRDEAVQWGYYALRGARCKTGNPVTRCPVWEPGAHSGHSCGYFETPELLKICSAHGWHERQLTLRRYGAQSLDAMAVGCSCASRNPIDAAHMMKAMVNALSHSSVGNKRPQPLH